MGRAPRKQLASIRARESEGRSFTTEEIERFSAAREQARVTAEGLVKDIAGTEKLIEMYVTAIINNCKLQIVVDKQAELATNRREPEAKIDEIGEMDKPAEVIEKSL
jgi:hypothetical protein